MPATVTKIADRRNTPVRHYAHLGDVEGIAQLIPGGYAFTADASGQRRLVAYNDVDLVLHGLVDAAPAPRFVATRRAHQTARPGWKPRRTSRRTLAQDIASSLLAALARGESRSIADYTRNPETAAAVSALLEV